MIRLLLTAWHEQPLSDLGASVHVDGLPGSSVSASASASGSGGASGGGGGGGSGSGRAIFVLSPLLCVLAGPGSELAWPACKSSALMGSGVLASRTPKACVLSAPDPHLRELGAPSPVSALLPSVQALISAEIARAVREGKKWPSAAALVDQKATVAPASHGEPTSGGGGASISWLTLLSRSRQPRAHETCELLAQHSRLDATPVRLRLRAEAAELALLEALHGGGDVGAIQAWVAGGSAITLDWSSLQAPTLSALDSLATDADDGALLAALLADAGAALPLTTLRLTGGTTILHRAAAANRAPKVRLLLHAKADCHEQRTPKGDTALHLAVAASALETVDVLLADTSGQRCVHAKNAEGRTPTDCVDKSKKSASAAAAKKIRQMLLAVAEEMAQAKAQAAAPPDAARGPSSATPSPGGSQPPSPPKPKPAVTSPPGKEATAPKPPPRAPVSAAEALHKRLSSESTALTRRALEEDLAKPLGRDGGGTAGSLHLRPKEAPVDRVAASGAGGASAAGGANTSDAAAIGAAASSDAATSGAAPSHAPPTAAATAAHAPADGTSGVAATNGTAAGAHNAVVPSPASRASCNEHADLFEDHPWRVLIVRPVCTHAGAFEPLGPAHAHTRRRLPTPLGPAAGVPGVLSLLTTSALFARPCAWAGRARPEQPRGAR